MNPFALKELRQLTRSRVISGALMTFLFLSVLATYLIPLNGIDHATGRGLLAYLQIALHAMFSVLVPIHLFVRMLRERRMRNADLTLLTPLSPAATVDGKLCSAYALMFLFSAASLPFAVAAYLLHGVSFVDMFKTLAVTLGYSCAAIHLALAVAAIPFSPVVRSLLALLYFFPASIATLTSISFTSSVATMRMESLLVTLAVQGTVCLLLRAQTIAWISPPVMERDAPLRTVSLFAAIGWLAYALLRHWSGAARTLESVLFGTIMLFVALAVWLALCAVGQGAGYSQRQLAERPASRLGRAATGLFRSGTVNGLAFALVFGLAVGIVLPLVAPHIDALYRLQAVTVPADSEQFRSVKYPYAPLVVFAYFMAVLMYFRCGWYHLLRQSAASPALVPIVAVFVFALVQSLPTFLSHSIEGGCPFLPFCFDCDWSLYFGSHAVSAAIALGLGFVAMIPETLAALRAKYSPAPSNP